MAEPMDEERDGLDAVASRRRVVRWSAGLFAGALALGGLAACGGGGDEEEDEGGGGGGGEGEEEEEEDD
ncbi:MAG: hypothetical protein M3Q10_02195 [Chloroflexota bacterium]|nr:hypothetical protein [Chloroflexota bacterium]